MNKINTPLDAYKALKKQDPNYNFDVIYDFDDFYKDNESRIIYKDSGKIEQIDFLDYMKLLKKYPNDEDFKIYYVKDLLKNEKRVS